MFDKRKDWLKCRVRTIRYKVKLKSREFLGLSTKIARLVLVNVRVVLLTSKFVGDPSENAFCFSSEDFHISPNGLFDVQVKRVYLMKIRLTALCVALARCWLPPVLLLRTARLVPPLTPPVRLALLAPRAPALLASSLADFVLCWLVVPALATARLRLRVFQFVLPRNLAR